MLAPRASAMLTAARAIPTGLPCGMLRRDFHLLLGTLASPLVGACHATTRPVASKPEPPPPAPQPSAFRPWVSDQGDGTYRNPVLYADYSDPDVIRVGEEYFLVASSFNCTPGLPILSSRDLVNWSFATHALTNLPDARYAAVQHGAGIWAPSLREHAGKFYLFAPTPDEGIYVLTAPHPRGPWSEPQLLLEGKGLIDPCPLWDDDGRAYLVHAYAGSRAGIKDRLRVRPMSPDATSVLGEGEIVYMDPEHQPTLEGPKFYKVNGRYYILAPAGGVEKGWQLALRSDNVFGPYEARTVLEQGATSINGPHQGALVDTPTGEWWFIHFQDAGIYGRVVHLNPVTWEDGWPLMGVAGADGKREPVLRHAKPKAAAAPITAPATDDDFDGTSLSTAFQWHGNHDPSWASLTARAGFLRLFARHAPGFANAPHLLLQKLPGPTFSVETWVESSGLARGEQAGLIAMGEHHFALAVSPVGTDLELHILVDDTPTERALVTARGVRLRLTLTEDGMCRFSFGSREGVLTPLGAPFKMTRGRWIGAKIGLFALAAPGAASSGYADFDYFRFGPP